VIAWKRADVEAELSKRACALGADGIMMDREEYARPYVGTDVAATAFAYGTSRGPQPTPAATLGCEPPCSPGYACSGTTCVAECNPPCVAPRVCSADRTCR
jgi:hypothetical protein